VAGAAGLSFGPPVPRYPARLRPGCTCVGSGRLRLSNSVLPPSGHGPGGVHGVGRRSEVTGVEVGVGTEVDGGVVTKCRGGGRYGHTLPGHQTGGGVAEYVRRGTRWQPSFSAAGCQTRCRQLESRTMDPSEAVKIGASGRSGTWRFRCASAPSGPRPAPAPDASGGSSCRLR